MPLTENQIRLLEGIQKGLKYGDIGIIAERTKFSRAWVSNVLSLASDDFNEDIVREAVAIIAIRQQDTKRLLQKIKY